MTGVDHAALVTSHNVEPDRIDINGDGVVWVTLADTHDVIGGNISTTKYLRH